MAHTLENSDTCPYCGELVLQAGVLYTDGDIPSCPHPAERPRPACCSEEFGLHLHRDTEEE